MSSRLKLLVCVGAVGIASLACSASAAANAWEVNDTGNGTDFNPNGDDVCEVTSGGGDCTLRAALAEANDNASDLDTITFEAGLGTIVQASTALLIEGPTTIDGNGPSGAGATVIDGADANQVFVANGFVGDPIATFKDLRIEDGFDADNGAGIETGMNTVITNSVVTSNSITPGGSGAGISSSNGDSDSLIIEDSQITNNTITTGASPGSGLGAGISTNGGLTLTDSVVSGNSIDGTGGDGADGGGMYVNSDITILRSTISGNSISGSATARGAGLFGSNGPNEITNSTISTNTNTGSGFGGGGGAFMASNLTLTNVTFGNNTASPTGGGADLQQGFGTATVQNTIFGSPSACAGTIVPAMPGHNIDSGTSCGIGSANGNMSSTDPLMQTGLVEFGSGQKVHILLFGSPAIDNADPTCGGLSVDQVGLERPQGTVCDIGAYERNYRDLGVTVNGNGSVAGTGISCGGDCTESYVDGDTVVLTATPATGFQLASWSGCTPAGNQCTVDMGNDRLVTADFSAAPPPPPGGGGTTTTPPTLPKKCKKGQKLKKGKCVKKKRKKKK